MSTLTVLALVIILNWFLTRPVGVVDVHLFRDPCQMDAALSMLASAGLKKERLPSPTHVLMFESDTIGILPLDNLFLLMKYHLLRCLSVPMAGATVQDGERHCSLRCPAMRVSPYSSCSPGPLSLPPPHASFPSFSCLFSKSLASSFNDSYRLLHAASATFGVRTALAAMTLNRRRSPQ